MATNQYIGARYVPVFADPAEWDSTKTYEPLTIVMHNGNSYTSAQYVPKGIDISNESFWKLTGNYNAQVEQYRKEVTSYDGRITDNADAIATEKNRATAAEKVNADAIATEKNRATAAEKVNADAIAVIQKPIMLCFGDSWSAQDSQYSNPSGFWNARLARDFGCTFKNYAHNGAGFTIDSRGGTDYIIGDQINTANTELSANEKKAVEWVFIVGGTNDFGKSVSLDTVCKKLTEDARLAQSYFTNARVVCAVTQFPPLGDVEGYFKNYGTAWSYQKQADKYFSVLVDRDFDYVPELYTAFLVRLLGKAPISLTTNHPTDYGQFLIYKKMLEKLSGETFTRNFNVVSSIGDGPYITAKLVGTEFKIRWYIKPTETAFTLPTTGSSEQRLCMLNQAEEIPDLYIKNPISTDSRWPQCEEFWVPNIVLPYTQTDASSVLNNLRVRINQQGALYYRFNVTEDLVLSRTDNNFVFYVECTGDLTC